MVQSNGTRWESHRFRIDFTGSTKYSGRSPDFLFVSAGGEEAARRAMPTSRTCARSLEFTARFRTESSGRLRIPPEIPDAGGQSVVWGSEIAPCWPATGARLQTACLGRWSSGHSEKSPAGVGEAWWRRIRKSRAVEE